MPERTSRSAVTSGSPGWSSAGSRDAFEESPGSTGRRYRPRTRSGQRPDRRADLRVLEAEPGLVGQPRRHAATPLQGEVRVGVEDEAAEQLHAEHRAGGDHGRRWALRIAAMNARFVTGPGAVAT